MIKLPTELVDAIRKNVDNSIQFKAAKLRENYRSQKNHEGMFDTYLMSRMPATYTAIYKVLGEIPLDANIKTVLDIGSGPGTGLWAVREHFKSLESYIGFEGDPRFVELAQRLNNDVSTHYVEWMRGRYPANLPNTKADLVLMSYTVGENSHDTIAKTIAHVWEHNVSEWLVVIEPGTPKGFGSILNIRQYLIENGGHVCAPCKGNYQCPLSEHDWCHFSVRLERTAQQKHVKEATLPYEDEKFSYLIVRKTPVLFKADEGRIIKKPMIRPGHVTLDVCSDAGHERRTISKSQKEMYPAAKKAEWGDVF
jgi:ribosomal protein RSM22 (predicted rRNA methylase)